MVNHVWVAKSSLLAQDPSATCTPLMPVFFCKSKMKILPLSTITTSEGMTQNEELKHFTKRNKIITSGKRKARAKEGAAQAKLTLHVLDNTFTLTTSCEIFNSEHKHIRVTEYPQLGKGPTKVKPNSWSCSGQRQECHHEPDSVSKCLTEQLTGGHSSTPCLEGTHLDGPSAQLAQSIKPVVTSQQEMLMKPLHGKGAEPAESMGRLMGVKGRSESAKHQEPSPKPVAALQLLCPGACEVFGTASRPGQSGILGYMSRNHLTLMEVQPIPDKLISSFLGQEQWSITEWFGLERP
ncbi:hypothetical protein WISP_101036 [Willisornis vidua]|uniref:Uncharacterized protein n=1 Tax=Willisornis vidua TaxID=1566151 RepID=A0ABQ9D4L9_9PASS|nr:hypothetical protein WISP_101036 [Willisornis vidua]